MARWAPHPLGIVQSADDRPGTAPGGDCRDLRGPWGGGPYYAPPAISEHYWI
ncbi:hypothetical protein GCM10009574_059210 [Streptomyces asiaticus]|uniref:Uncharacterized protein n=2 Tax=Streptomyces rhizosphaericus TaxID=114699 RepID=A0ABN1RZ13_9ACTN